MSQNMNIRYLSALLVTCYLLIEKHFIKKYSDVGILCNSCSSTRQRANMCLYYWVDPDMVSIPFESLVIKKLLFWVTIFWNSCSEFLELYNDLKCCSYYLDQNIIQHYSLILQNDMTPLIMSETPTSRKQTLDRGYPPQHTAASEQEYEQRRRETKLEHRDRRPYQTPVSPAESYNRPRDDPKQVSARYVINSFRRN